MFLLNYYFLYIKEMIEITYLLTYLLANNNLNPLMTKEGGGGGGGCHPQQVFLVFSRMGRAFISNKIFSCNLILETSFHQKIFQIGDFLDFFLTYFSNREDDIQSYQILAWSKIVPRSVRKKLMSIQSKSTSR